MKKKYQKPEFEVVFFRPEDVIATSENSVPLETVVVSGTEGSLEDDWT